MGNFCIMLCFMFGFVAVVAEANPNEHFEQLVGESAEYMTYEFFEGILDRLNNRFSSLKECFDHEKFHDLVPHGERLSQDGFFNVSIAMVNIIADAECSGRLDTSKISDGHTVVDSLRDLDYHGLHETTTCFSEETLNGESGHGFTTAVILFLYRGDCLLPEKDFFTAEYIKFFGDSAGDLTKEGFLNFLQNLSIGEQHVHDGHDHGSHDGHDHEEHGNGDDHDGHDHDHHGTNETDTDHDHDHDPDHHGTNETDTDHDHDHDPDHHGTNETDTDHDHDHDHDHHRTNETDTDHDHDHDPDHHGTNETDTDHDHDHDPDHHGTNETDTDHDHDHDDDHHGANETDTDHDHDHDPDHHGTNETDTDHDHDHDHDHAEHEDNDHHGNDNDRISVTTVPPANTAHEDDHDHDHDHDHAEHEDNDHHGNDNDHISVTTVPPVNRPTTHEDEHDHDHDHHHSRRKRSTHEEEEETPRCYTGDQLATIYGLGSTISQMEALEICPALIQQIISGACNTADSHQKDKTGYTESMIYGYGTLSVAIISLLAILGLLLFPALETKGYKITMQFFIGLAIGTMAADAVVHIIPKILGVHVHGAHDDHDHAAGEEDKMFVWQMSLLLGGLYFVFFFENLMKAVKRSRQIKENGSGTLENAMKLDSTGSDDAGPSDDLAKTKRKQGSKSTLDSDEMLDDQNIICWFFNPTLITVFIGDILHNFADGVAIGVAFAVHWSTGISTSIAILCHELPHEFGDFAIYLRNGASKWKAIGLNFSAACCAFIGLYSGINMASEDDVRQWLLCIIAGIFLYISLVQVMSLMLREPSDRPVLVFLTQNAGMFIGWVIMLLIALYEDRIRVGV